MHQRSTCRRTRNKPNTVQKMSPTSRASDTALLLIHQPHNNITRSPTQPAPRASKEHTESKQQQQKKTPNTGTTKGRITKGRTPRSPSKKQPYSDCTGRKGKPLPTLIDPPSPTPPDIPNYRQKNVSNTNELDPSPLATPASPRSNALPPACRCTKKEHQHTRGRTPEEQAPKTGRQYP